mgnify:CR=1 FL=1
MVADSFSSYGTFRNFVSVKRVVVGCAINLLLLVLTAYPLCLPQRRFPAGKYLKWFFAREGTLNGT